MNKFDYPESGYVQPDNEQEEKIFTEPFVCREIFGKKVLITDDRAFCDLYKTLPQGVQYFAVRGCDSDPEYPATIEDVVRVNRVASILSMDDILADERKEGVKDVYHNLTPEEREDIYDIDYSGDQDYEDSEELMTISDFIHKDDQEYQVSIEEVIHHNVTVKAKDMDEALTIAAKKYNHIDDYVKTYTEGSIDDILLSVQDPETEEYGEYIDLYNLLGNGIV